jgi:hypothetical protein
MNSYWVAANHHLLHYDKTLLLIKEYTKDDGIPVFALRILFVIITITPGLIPTDLFTSST